MLILPVPGRLTDSHMYINMQLGSLIAIHYNQPSQEEFKLLSLINNVMLMLNNPLVLDSLIRR